MELKLLMTFLPLWSVQTSVGSAAAPSRDVTSSLQVKPELNVDVLLGGATELQCRNKTTEGLVRWWQTPFGSVRDQKLSNTDPIQIVNGNLRIIKATESHSGLYQCHLLDSRSTTTTIIPYRVNIVNKNSHKMMRTRMRKATENEASAGVSDQHFAAAVSSSVLVTFIAAFTLGAFSQPYVIKCLKRTRVRMCYKNAHQESTTDQKENINKPSQIKVFFRRNLHSEDTVDFSKSPESIETPANGKTNPDQDGVSEIELEINNRSNTGADDESDKQTDEGGHKQEAEINRKQPKRVSRVIKLYNYDEEGNPYSHVKESEIEPTPRQRVMSLTRLQNIMNQAEHPDFFTSTDSGEPDKPSLDVT